MSLGVMRGLVHAWLRGNRHSTDTAHPEPELHPPIPTAQGQFQTPFSEVGCYQARGDLDTSLEELPRPQLELWPPVPWRQHFLPLPFLCPCPATTEVDER